MKIDYWECMKLARNYAKGKGFMMEVRKNTVTCGWNVYVKVQGNDRFSNIGKVVHTTSEVGL